MDPNPAALPDEDPMLLAARGIVAQPAGDLFRRHDRVLYHFFARQCQWNPAEAEDITQRTWEKLMTRCADYRPQAGSALSCTGSPATCGETCTARPPPAEE